MLCIDLWREATHSCKEPGHLARQDMRLAAKLDTVNCQCCILMLHSSPMTVDSCGLEQQREAIVISKSCP